MRVSIHAPWEGCDGEVLRLTDVVVVSIHAPWEGCDTIFHTSAITLQRFNSRTLGRVRQGSGNNLGDINLCFNSRTLGRVRPLLGGVFGYFGQFQFTHPGKGATDVAKGTVGRLYGFNSRTLGRVRHDMTAQVFHSLVSIHAPWEGCDERIPREKTPYHSVSIHAPWEGCDKSPRSSSLIRRLFQFTHPGKGATCIRSCVCLLVGLFQFTHPGKGAT